MNVHLIAMGGSVMHNLAIALKRSGHKVSGSDDAFYEPSRSRLAKAGLIPENDGWDTARITEKLDAVILGMHARSDNPELLRAEKLNIPVYSFPEYIYNQSKSKTRVAICGSHGKTTITSMIMHVLKAAGTDFDYLVGAQLEGFDIMVRLSDAPLLVVEGDEYLASARQPVPKFSFYRAGTVLLSGISWDHINVFPTFEKYLQAFSDLIKSLEPGNTLVANATDENVVKLIKEVPKGVKVQLYNEPEFTQKGDCSLMTISGKSYRFNFLGAHNLLNMEGAHQICESLGIGSADFYKHMTNFKGAAKRLECIRSDEHHTIYRDFAHSPSKVKASVSAIKAQYRQRPLCACLELHTFSSLNPVFLPEYSHSLDAADRAIVMFDPEVLRAKKLHGLNSELISRVFEHPNLSVVNSAEQLMEHLAEMLTIDTNILLMSSGHFQGLNLDILLNSSTNQPQI